MFDIEYKGANGLLITTKKVQLAIDPKISVAGLKDLSVKDAVEIATEARFSVNDAATRLRIEGPGEYEVADVSIKGVKASRHLDAESEEQLDTIYRIEIGDIRIALIGNIAPKLSEEQLEEIGIVDIAIIPVGGNGYTLDATSAATIARQIDPRAVIPVHYADPAIKYEVPQDGLETFISELGAPVDEPVAKYKVKSQASIPQVLTVINLERS